MDEFEYRPQGLGWIEVIASGGMSSGKSTEIIRRLRRAEIGGKKIQVFKHSLDNRWVSNAIVSRDGLSFPAVPVTHSDEIRERLLLDTEIVGIDEAQFFDDGIVDVINELADTGIRVIVAGLSLTFAGKPFGPMGDILACAEKVDKLTAVCVKCGAPATRPQRLIDGKPAPENSPTILVGDTESYESRCRRCHIVPRTDDTPLFAPFSDSD